MKTFKECQHQVALSWGFNGWIDLINKTESKDIDELYKEVADLYALQITSYNIQKCTEMSSFGQDCEYIDVDSILNMEIILP